MFHKYRSTRPKVFCKNDVSKGFTKVTIEHLRRSLVLKKQRAYRKSGTQDPKVGPRTLRYDPKVRP